MVFNETEVGAEVEPGVEWRVRRVLALERRRGWAGVSGNEVVTRGTARQLNHQLRGFTNKWFNDLDKATAARAGSSNNAAAATPQTSRLLLPSALCHASRSIGRPRSVSTQVMATVLS